jgi:hypothetical protein
VAGGGGVLVGSRATAVPSPGVGQSVPVTTAPIELPSSSIT